MEKDIRNDSPADQISASTAALITKYGPLLTIDALVEVLGFASAAAFDRYWRRGNLELKLVRLPKRRGVFAHAADVARYLVEETREVTVQPREREASSRG